MTLARLVVAVGFLALAVAAPVSVEAALCGGDCNGDGRVTVSELVRGVNISLGSAAFGVCPPIDTGGNQHVDIDELVAAVGFALSSCPAATMLHRAPELTAVAGPSGAGNGVLPNGRRVAPAGTQIALDTFPLNLALTPDGTSVLLTNDGWGNEEGQRGLQVVDLAGGQSTRVEVPHFFGLALAPSGDRVFVSDGDSGTISALRLEGGAWVRESAPVATIPGYPMGMAVSADGSHLFVVGLTDNQLRTIDLASGAVHSADAGVGNFPYTVILSADGKRAFVSAWGLNNSNPPSELPAPLPPLDPNAETRSSIVEVDISNPDAPSVVRYAPIARSLAIDARTIFGGSHPSAMALSPDGAFLYVTATNLDLLVVLDAANLETVAEVPLNPFEQGPLATQLQGLYPNALAVRADGRRLYIADAGINAVQVVDVDPAARTFTPAGFIPVGWYPSALAVRDGTLYVANAKGAGVGANDGDPLGDSRYYIGRIIRGSVSVIADADTYDLAAGTATVRDANGFAPVEVQWVDAAPTADQVQRGLPVPIDYGRAPSDQIKHVVFILKENRTYDQVFGDVPEGNGDPRLVMFGEHVTPNAHALAREFAMGDNFYCDGEVSLPGHEWTDQANDTDFTEKIWPRNYNGNISEFVAEFGQEGFSKNGYIFEALQSQDVSYRVYGETLHFLTRDVAGIDGGGAASIAPEILDAFGGNIGAVLGGLVNLLSGDVAALERTGVNVDKLRNEIWPNIMIGYPANILANFRDTERASLFLSELHQFEQRGEMPSYVHIWLPNDHTFGAAPGNPTPDQAVADNDAGLGQIIDGLTHSRFWPNMAIFVTEDDAQDGQDHVSAHRSLGLVISPYVKRGYISHVHHSQVSMLKTTELLLGIRPLSEYDRYATDMRDYFTSVPDLTPYEARPQQVPFQLNPEPEEAPNAYLRQAAELSEDLNLSMYDEAGENLGVVLRLVSAGNRLERTKMWAGCLAALIPLAMIIGGLLVGRRQVAQAQPPPPAALLK